MICGSEGRSSAEKRSRSMAASRPVPAREGRSGCGEGGRPPLPARGCGVGPPLRRGPAGRPAPRYMAEGLLPGEMRPPMVRDRERAEPRRKVKEKKKKKKRPVLHLVERGLGGEGSVAMLGRVSELHGAADLDAVSLDLGMREKVRAAAVLKGGEEAASGGFGVGGFSRGLGLGLEEDEELSMGLGLRLLVLVLLLVPLPFGFI